MDFSWTEEQQLIARSASDWLQHHYDFRQRDSSVHREGGAPTVWQAMADLGWLGLPLQSDVGGLELGPLECGLLAQQLGRYLVVEPWIGHTLKAAHLLNLAGTAAQRQRWLPGAIDGSHRLALAHTERARPWWEPPQLHAHCEGGAWLLTGSKHGVEGAAGATRWIVSAHLHGAGASGTALFLVDPAQTGIHVDTYLTSDGSTAANLTFDAVHVAHDDRLDHPDAAAALQRVCAQATVARCWSACGTMQQSLEQTTAYVQQRKQFGQALAQFQVVQHRLAEMAVLCTEAQAACELAALRLGQSTAQDDTTISSAAKSKVARAAHFVAKECVQLHGAMGVCEELPIASAFRALNAFLLRDGDGASHALHIGQQWLHNRAFAHSRTLDMGHTIAQSLPASEALV